MIRKLDNFICRNFDALFLCVICTGFVSNAAVAVGEYQTGVDLYGKHRYAEAAPYFEAASIASPSNAAANYYAGYCFYLAGRRPESCSSFWRLVRNNPSSKEAADARALLQKLDPNYAKNISTSAATKSEQSRTRSATSGRPSTAEVINSLITVMPAKGKLANVSPAFVESVKEMLVTVPLPILIFFRDHGGSIVVAPSVVENVYRLQNTVPRGWEGDHDWKNSPALTHGKQVQIGQFRLDPRTGDYVDTTSELGVVRHELGHGIDHCLGYYSSSEEFKHPYLLDVGNVPAEYTGKLDYFLQKAGSGPSETFAELFCHYVGGETANRVETCELTHKYFPSADKAMLAKLNTL